MKHMLRASHSSGHQGVATSRAIPNPCPAGLDFFSRVVGIKTVVRDVRQISKVNENFEGHVIEREWGDLWVRSLILYSWTEEPIRRRHSQEPRGEL